jgi:hypothetical protein
MNDESARQGAPELANLMSRPNGSSDSGGADPTVILAIAKAAAPDRSFALATSRNGGVVGACASAARERKCPFCSFRGFPGALEQHLLRSHAREWDEIEELVRRAL